MPQCTEISNQCLRLPSIIVWHLNNPIQVQASSPCPQGNRAPLKTLAYCRPRFGNYSLLFTSFLRPPPPFRLIVKPPPLTEIPYHSPPSSFPVEPQYLFFFFFFFVFTTHVRLARPAQHLPPPSPPPLITLTCYIRFSPFQVSMSIISQPSRYRF